MGNNPAWLIWLILAWLLGLFGPGGAGVPGDFDDPVDVGDDDDDDDDDDDGNAYGHGNGNWNANLDEYGPCVYGDWGHISDPRHAIHVRVDGDDANGDGTVVAPYLTIERAQEDARLSPISKRDIAVGAGTFSTRIVFDSADDDATVVQGCGVDETFLVAADPALPILDFAMSGDLGVTGLTLDGGTKALTIRGNGSGWAQYVDVNNSSDVGIAISGDDTVAVLLDVNVATPLVGNACGWGIWVEQSSIIMVDSAVTGATEVGILVDGGVGWFENVVVDGTVPNGSLELGRGVHAQNSWIVIANSTFIGNADASIFFLDPLSGIISTIVIDHTDAGLILGGDTTGDAVAIVGSPVNGVGVILRSSAIFDSERTAVLIEDAKVFLDDNSAIGTGLFPVLGSHAYRQGPDAQVTGPQAAMVLDVSASPLDLNRDYLTCP